MAMNQSLKTAESTCRFLNGLIQILTFTTKNSLAAYAKQI